MGLCLQRQKKKKHTKIRVGLEQRIVFTTVKKTCKNEGQRMSALTKIRKRCDASNFKKSVILC